ncbi:MAG TPA: response regulator [Kofleriaceae bacterium]|nr:response regulator [Kofleriaceae bacterium]
MAPEVPETVIVVATRGWSGGGGATALRELIDRLVAAGVETALVNDASEAARALVDDEGAVVIIDVDDAARGLTTPQAAAARVAEIAAAAPDAAPVAVAQRPAVSLVIACLRAGAADFVDLGAESFDVTAAALAAAAGRRARNGAQKRAVGQLRDMVEQMLKDLVRTERRSIDLEKQLAQKSARDAGLAFDVDAERDPVVMVVEDDRDMANFLCDALEDNSITTFAFVTGEEAVAHADRMAARGQALDLVLIDIGLPGIDGLEVVRRLRKDRPGLAAFLITGFADPNLTARAADLGVVGFVLKPFDDSRVVIERIRSEALAAMSRTRDHGYLQRIKVRHDKVLTQYRLLIAELEK